METVPMEKFGKDHWSLLAYVECRCVDHGGVLAKVHLRIKNPAVQPPAPTPMGWPRWKPSYGTHLKGYWKEDGSKDQDLQLPDHDDLDCLDDLENAGLIENFGSGFFPAKKLTKFGEVISAQLRAHKAEGGQFAEFSPVLFKKGDPVKVQFGGSAMTEANGGKPKYKLGTFEKFSKSGKFGFFLHHNSGKILKRPLAEISHS